MSARKETFKRIKNLSSHIIVWALLFFLNYLLLDNFKVPFDFSYHFKLWLIYIVLFYINYLFLMPFLLFRKKRFLYIISLIFLTTGLFYVKDSIEKINFDKIRSERGFPQYKNHSVEKQDHIPDLPGPKFRMVPPPRMGFMPLYSLLIVLAASTTLRLVQKWQDDEKRKTEIERERVTTELSFLKQQINPHFLFNALNNIYSLTLSSSSPASEAILKLSSILRYMLYETENTTVLLKDELNILADFIELQKIRITDKVKIKYEVIGSPGHLKIAPLLLIPLVENAYKYGIDNVNESFIDISIKIHSGQFQLNVSNNVVTAEFEDENSGGIGIKNIKRRLDLLYPGNYTFETIEKDSIFNVELKIKLNT